MRSRLRAAGTTGAPTPRDWHTAVWASSRMIVWGGSSTNTGGIYGGPAVVAEPTDFFTVPPCRLVDTRNAAGPTGGPALGASATRSFPVTGGTCGVPPTAKAASVNVAAVGATAPGSLVLFLGDAFGPPLPSTINFIPEVTRANNAVVALATDGTGTINVMNSSTAAVHFVLDVNGYFQ